MKETMFRRKVDRAYVIHSKNLRVDGKVVYIPIYMTMFHEVIRQVH